MTTTETVPTVCDELLAGAATVTRMADWLADHPELTDDVDTRCYGGTSVQIRPATTEAFNHLSTLLLELAPADTEGERRTGNGTDRVRTTIVNFTPMIYVLVVEP